MTTRDKFSHEFRIYSYDFYLGVNQGPMALADSHAAGFHLVSERFGERNPDWWIQVRYGQNATTNASGTVDRMIGGPFFTSLTYFDGVNEYKLKVQGDPHLVDIPPPPSVGGGPFISLNDSVRNAVLTKFIKKCAQTQRKILGGVFLGELRQTIQLIRNPLKAFENAIQEYARACRGRSRKLSPRLIPKMLAQEYLSFTYGVQPLFADIRGAYDACIRLRDLPQLEKVRVAVQEELEFSTDSRMVMFFGIGATRESVQYARVLGVIRGAVKVQSVGPAPPLMEVSGARLRDFLPTVYELIPYSFVLDYFLNVGDIIECLSFCQADLAWHNRTVRTSSVSTQFFSRLQDAPLYSGSPVREYSFTNTYAQRSQVAFVRDSQPLGLPHLVAKLPGPKQAFNLAALASARVL